MKPSGAKPNLLETVQAGDYRTQLEAVRDELVTAMETSPPGAKAQTAAQLRAVLKDLESLPKTNKVTLHDDLARKRKDRRAAAQTAARAAGDSQ